MITIINDKRKVTTECFGDLDVGDTFIYNEELYIKSDKIHDRALNLSHEGDWEELNMDTEVIPVNIEIKIIKE